MNENHGPDGKFASGDSGGLIRSAGSSFRGKGNTAQLRKFLDHQLDTYTKIVTRTGDEQGAMDKLYKMAEDAGIKGLNADRTLTIAIHRYGDELNRKYRERR